VVKDEDSVLSQEDLPLGIKKQAPSVRDIAIQVDQPKYIPVNVPPGQLSGISSIKTMAM